MTKTPTKRTSSPRKKSAWATAAKSPMKSPRKAAASRSLAEMLETYEGLNKSWAEEMEDEMQRRTLGEASASPREQRGGTRRKGVSPKRADPKPRFVKSLEAQEITEAISAGQFRNLRSSTRAATAAIKAAAKPKSKPIVDSVEIVESVEVIETTTSYISPTATRTRKRHISTSSTATDLEPASPSRRGLLTPQRSSGRPARKNAKMDGASPARNRINTSLVHQSPSADFRAKDYWEEPKLGWCQDAATIERREKELNRAKEKPVYPAYLEKVPKDQRVKGIHPVTPNKYLNYPRRSWDTLMRNWKRQLYEFADITPSPSVATSANTSFCSSEGQDGEELVDTKHILRDISVNVPSGRTEEDSVAFHLGNFDLDTRTLGAGGDESTIKGAGGKCVGPTDFAHAVAHGAKK